MKKKEIKELIRYMRYEQERINKKFEGKPYIRLSVILDTIKGDSMDIHPFRFDLRSGICFGENIEGKMYTGRFW